MGTFRVSSFGFRVSGFGFRVSTPKSPKGDFLVSGFGLEFHQLPDFCLLTTVFCLLSSDYCLLSSIITLKTGSSVKTLFFRLG